MLRIKLSVMMFLEFFIWGAWLPLIFDYLGTRGFSPDQKTWIMNAFVIASLVGMFFSNQFADRAFAAEKFLALSHFIGGLAFLGLFWAQGFWQFFGLMMLHCLFYVPTISITNSIAFANLKDPQAEFGPVRLWGTIGWIAAGWTYTVLPYLIADQKIALNPANMFLVGGISSIVLAGFSLALPHTPPKPATEGQSSFAFLEAVKYLKVPFILALFVVTFIDAMVHQGYFLLTGGFLKSIGVKGENIGAVMSVGQVAEIGTMAVLGYFLKGLGWRKIMVIGILGHTIRFGVFALFPYQVPVIASILLHGICYAFFFATVYIFIDEFLPKDARTSAQGLFNVLILGIGPLAANYVWPYVMDKTTDATVTVEVAGEKDAKKLIAKGTMPLDGEEFELKYRSSGGSDSSWQSIKLPTKKDFEQEIAAAAPGTYEFEAIPVKRNLLLFGESTRALQIPELKYEPEQMGATESPKVNGSVPDYQKLFLYPSGTALAAAVLLLLFFHPPKTAGGEKKAPTAMAH